MYRIYRDTRFSDNKTPYKTHVAAVVSDARPRQARRRRRVLPHLARRSLDRRRHMLAAAAAALRRPRAHRRPRQAAARHRRIAGLPQAGRTRSKARRCKRVPRGFREGSSGGRVPEAPAFHRRRRAPGGARHQPGVLQALLLTVFRQVVPLARFLNAPLLKRVNAARRPRQTAVSRQAMKRSCRTISTRSSPS